MMKWINKKRNRKGFTLVELVVVIAILGILAAIAVPRMTGFTSRAEKAADEQYGAVIGNSLTMLLATGEIIKTDTSKEIKVEIDKGGNITAVTNIEVEKNDQGEAILNDIKAELIDLVAPTKLQYYTKLEVIINTDGAVGVSGTEPTK